MGFRNLFIAGVTFLALSFSSFSQPYAAEKKVRILSWGSNDAEQLGSSIEKSSSQSAVWATEVEKVLDDGFDVLQIEGGVYVSCLLRSDKTVWCWGGGDTFARDPQPPSTVRKVQNLPPIKSLSMGSSYTHCAVSEDDRVWCWDENNFSATSLLERNWFGIQDLKLSLQRISIGHGQCASSVEGAVYCWGEKYRNVVRIPLERKANQVKVGFKQACAILEDRSVSCWPNSPSPKPQSILAGNVEAVDIMTAWEKGCALLEDRTVWCWKSLGWKDDDSIPPPSQVRITDEELLTDVMKVSNQGNTLFCALRKDSSVWCWDGPVGDLNTEYRSGFAMRVKSPDGICNLSYATDVATGAHTGFAVIRATEEEYQKLQNECIPDDVKISPNHTKTSNGRDKQPLLEAISNKIHLMDKSLKENPRKELFLQKIALLEKFQDYEQLRLTYPAALSLPAGMGAAELDKGKCKDEWEWKEGMPEVLKTSTTDKSELLTAYGRVLFHLGDDNTALRALCMAESLSTSPEPRQWITQILQKQGKIDDNSGEKIDFTKAILKDQVFEGRKLHGVSFKGAQLANVKFINSDLTDADFTDAQMMVEIRGSDFSKAKLVGSKISGSITESKFDDAFLSKSQIDLSLAGGNSFKRADLTAATMILMECRSVKDWHGNDFGDAIFKGATISGLRESNTKGADFSNANFFTKRCRPQNQGLDLSGKQLNNTNFDFGSYAGGSFKGASLRNSTFRGNDLTGVDFSNADLTGADFTNSSYSGPAKLLAANFTGALIDNVKWDGALFDCKTRFPEGFKPEQQQMVTKDTSCASASTKNPGVVKYSKELLGKGYMNVCNGDYHTDCIYGFLASYYATMRGWGYEKELSRFADSFIDAGYPNLARIVAFRAIGTMALTRHSLDPLHFNYWTSFIEKLDLPRANLDVPRVSNGAIFADPELNLDGKSGIDLSTTALQYAERGDFDLALAYSKEIGSDQYNRTILKWGDTRSKSSSDYGREQQNFAGAMTVALERHRRGEDATAEINAMIDALQAKPEGRDQQMLAAAAMLAGMNSSRPDLLVEAYTVTGRLGKAWDIYEGMHSGNDPSRKISVLLAIADYYSTHPDEEGVARVVKELKSFALERWPQQGDMIFVGMEIGIHERIFRILSSLKSVSAIEQILSITEDYKNDDLKIRSRLYAAEAFAFAGDFEKAFANFDKCRKIISKEKPPTTGRRTQKFVIALDQAGGFFSKDSKIMIIDSEFGSFILAVAVSSASKEEKIRAINVGFELLRAGLAGSPTYRAQLAVANAAVMNDKDSGIKMQDAGYGVPPSVYADLLHKAGFHSAEKRILEVSWISGDAPPGIGIDRLGRMTGRQGWRNNNRLVALAGMLARDGHTDTANRVLRSIEERSAVPNLGGTDYPTYFLQQKTIYNLALSAVRLGKSGVAHKFVSENLTYKPYQAGIYFNLARVALSEKRSDDARKLYDKGFEMASSFGDAMGAPLFDPEGLALDVLIDRAAAELALGLAQRFEQTLSYARLAASLAEIDVQRGKTSTALDQIERLKTATEGADKQSIDSFIKTLNIQDDLNSTSVVAEMAEKYLKAGDHERARAVAMYGFRKIDNYPQARGKAHLLLPFASVIARTEPRMSEQTQRMIESILREAHENVPSSKKDVIPLNVDIVAEGEKAYAEIIRRSAVDEAPRIDQAQSSQYFHDGSIEKGDKDLMREWFIGATEKYNREHPEAKIIAPTEVTPWWVLKTIKKPITFPSVDWGSFRGKFLVPADVPRPKGPRLNATVFYMSDFTCEGDFPPFCNY